MPGWGDDPWGDTWGSEPPVVVGPYRPPIPYRINVPYNGVLGPPPPPPPPGSTEFFFMPPPGAEGVPIRTRRRLELSGFPRSAALMHMTRTTQGADITIGGVTYLGGRWNGPLTQAEVTAITNAGYATRIKGVNPGEVLPGTFVGGAP